MANQRNVVNLPIQARSALEQYLTMKVQAGVSQSAAVARPVASKALSSESTAESEDRIVRDALEKIERAKGQVARRNALERALQQVHSPDHRSQLLREAARLEVHAVLDKVDSLKSSAAKRRHIEAALAQLRADPTPDELQAEEIAWLEAALRDLG